MKKKYKDIYYILDNTIVNLVILQHQELSWRSNKILNLWITFNLQRFNRSAAAILVDKEQK